MMKLIGWIPQGLDCGQVRIILFVVESWPVDEIHVTIVDVTSVSHTVRPWCPVCVSVDVSIEPADPVKMTDVQSWVCPMSLVLKLHNGRALGYRCARWGYCIDLATIGVNL